LQAAPDAQSVVALLRARLGLASPVTAPGSEPASPVAGAASITLRIAHPVGLHARPAAKFVQTAARFQSEIEVANLTKATNFVNAKSVLKVLTLAVQQGNDISLRADGPDAEAALGTLRELVESNFGEPEGGDRGAG
jgi:phosphotransferase system HPr (HPr) family protein